MSTAALSQAKLDHLHEVMAGYVERNEAPGLVWLVSRHGEVHVDVSGTQALGGSVPMRRDTIFRISSMSKPITAAATMILTEEGVVRLDEPVDRLLPELAHRMVLRRLDGPLDDVVPAARSITVRDLLSFCMGFGIILAAPGTYPIQVATDELRLGQGMPNPATTPAPEEWMRRLGTLPLMHQPGAQWMYNTGSDVLSVLIARAAGQPLETFLRERLFEPLGMRDTAFSVPASKLNRFASSYVTHPQTGALTLYDPADGGQWSRPPAFPSGAGGLVSTIDDYLAFGQMMLNMGTLGSRRILSRQSVAAMTTDQLTPAQKAASNWVGDLFADTSWGFGVSMVTRHNGAAVAHGRYGWDGGLGATWCSDPGMDMVLILMTQSAWTSPIPPSVCRDFWNLAYQAVAD